MTLGCGQQRPVTIVGCCALTTVKFVNQFLNATRTLLVLVVPGSMNLQENPLRPLIEIFISGGHTATSVVSQSKSSQLSTHVGNVRLGINARMNTRSDRMLFCGKTKTVVAQCM